MPRAARITPEGLTLKEERFCQEFLTHGNAALAYKNSYDCNPNNQKRWSDMDAERLLKKPHIIARIQSLIAKTEVTALYAMDNAMSEAKEALELARSMKNPSAMVAAVQLRSKLAGLLIERRENTNRSVKELTEEELEAELQRAAKEAGLVIEKASKRELPKPEAT